MFCGAVDHRTWKYLCEKTQTDSGLEVQREMSPLVGVSWLGLMNCMVDLYSRM